MIEYIGTSKNNLVDTCTFVDSILNNQTCDRNLIERVPFSLLN